MRYFVALLLAILLVANACQKMTEPVGGQVGNFSFSFSKGDYWTYAVYDTSFYQQSGYVYELTDTINVFIYRDTVLNNGQRVHTQYTEWGDIGDFDYVRFAHDSLCIYSDLDGNLKNLFLFPLIAGRTWQVMQEKMEVLRYETIRTGVGEFKTFHIKRYISRADRSGEIDYWLADRVGIVRRFDNIYSNISKSTEHSNMILIKTNIK